MILEGFICTKCKKKTRIKVLKSFLFDNSYLDLECDANYFGKNCEEMCSVTCNGCNRKTGICDTGCKPGWRDVYCHKGICFINI